MWVYFWAMIFPIGMGSFQPSLSSLLTKNAGNQVGKVMGYSTSMQSIGNIFGPLVAGLLYFSRANPLPFMVSAGICLILLIISTLLRREDSLYEAKIQK